MCQVTSTIAQHLQKWESDVGIANVDYSGSKRGSNVYEVDCWLLTNVCPQQPSLNLEKM